MTYEKTADGLMEHEAGSGETDFAAKMMPELLRLFTDSVAILPVDL